MPTIFSSGRNEIPISAWSVQVGTVPSTLKAGTYYFSLQGRNRVGLNYPTYQEITIEENQSIRFSIYADAFKEGEDWLDFIIGTKNNDCDIDTDYYQVESVNAKYFNSEIPINSYPIRINITSNSYFAKETPFNLISNIVDSNIKNGQIIKITDSNLLYEFFKNEVPFEPFIPSSKIFKTTNGVYRFRKSSLTYIDDIYDYGGCNLDINSDLSRVDQLNLPVYPINQNQSPPLRFTLLNTGLTAIAKDSVIALNIYVDNKESTGLFKDAVFCIFRGFTNINTGELRTIDYMTCLECPELNVPIPYSVDFPNLYLPDKINPDEGLIIEIYLELSNINFVSYFEDNSSLYIYPSISSTIFRYSPFYEIFVEGVRVNKFDKFDIVPYESGQILVKSGQVISKGYSYLRTSEEILTIPNSSTQNILLNQIGRLSVQNSSLAFSDNLTKVATISKLVGKSKLSQPLVVTLDADAKTLNFKLKIGLDSNAKIKIKSLYEETTLRNVPIEPFLTTASLIIKLPNDLYVQTTVTLTNVVEQLVSISSITGLTQEELTLNTTSDFGLIDSPVLAESTENTSGSLNSGEYSIWAYYNYTGTDVTGISDVLPFFDLDSFGGGGSGNTTLYSVTISDSTFILNFKTGQQYYITLEADTEILNPVQFDIGSRILLFIQQDSIGNKVFTFDTLFKFGIGVTPFIDPTPYYVTVVEGFITLKGILCKVIDTYDATPPAVSSSLNNTNQLSNTFRIGN